MNSSLRIGTIWGFPVSLHLSWFLIFALVTWSLSSSYFPAEYPGLSMGVTVLLGVVTSILFFLSVLAHELGHAFFALRNRIPVKGITLFIFGGVAQIGEEPRSPGAEFRIALAGPLVSLALSGVFALAWLLDRAVPYLAAPSEYLVRINLMLALFNLIPGFPLDGGRLLRAVIWKLSGNLLRATQVASISGQVVAFGFIGLGILAIVNGRVMDGLWQILIGWFLQNAAASAYAQVAFEHSLRGLKVDQAMSCECDTIPARTPLVQVIEEKILAGGRQCFLVADGEQIQGLLTVEQLVTLPQSKWRWMTAGQVMSPLGRLLNVRPDSDLLAAVQLMESSNLALLPVLDHERALVGVLSRQKVAEYLRLKSQLGM